MTEKRHNHEFLEAWLDAILFHDRRVSRQEFRRYFYWRIDRIELRQPKADLPAYIRDVEPDWYLDGYIWRSFAPRPGDPDDSRWRREDTG